MNLSRTTSHNLGIRYAWVLKHSSAEVLSALGHPGYSDNFATAVLNLVEKHDYSIHEAIQALGQTGN